MSLLLKALQNAAKNREAGAAGEDPAAGAGSPSVPEERTGTSELSLEPMESATRSADASPSRAEPTLPPSTAPNTTPRGTERNAMATPNRTQAQNVFLAGAGGSAASDGTSPGIIEWLTRRPIVAFSTAAGIFAIGYGVYLYLQLTNPGIFVPKQGPVASAPPAPSPAPPPPSTQPVPATGAVPPSVPESSPIGAPSVPPPSAAAPTAAPAQAAAPAVVAPEPAAVAKATPKSVSGPATTDVARPGGTPTVSGPATPVVAAKPAPVAIVTAPREPAPGPRATTPSNRTAATTARGRPAPAAASTVQTQVNSDLSGAYQALERGQLNDAERLYRQALAAEPRNVDAMIGLGSTLIQQNRADAATQMYLRALEIDPRNSYAQAGLLSIGGRADPQAAEARLKQLIAREPSAYLYFTLGNLYAEQNQWSAAQGAYFQAFNMAPDNPDYAFNLAIGLEHLSQPKLALDYYRRAVSIAQSRGNAQFALAPAQARIRSLEAVLAERP